VPINAAQLYALVGVQGAGQSVRDLQSVSNQVNKTQGTMAALGKNAGQVGTGFAQVGAGLLRIGEIAAIAAGGAVVASAKIGTTFQQQMELIHTQAGATQTEVDTMSKAVQDLVHATGTGPIDLAKGLYHIESVGVRGAAALDILKASALGAKVGLADMETVSNALTAVWFSNISGVKDMTTAMGTLDAIVGVGNMRMQDLVDSFSTGILGTSKTFGVSLQSMGAALAVLSDAGVPAQVAATRLSMTFTHMAAPIPGAIKILKKLGLDQFTLAKDMRGPDGLDTALRDLGKHLQAVGEMSVKGILTPQGTADVAKLFGGSRFGATAMQLLANVMAPAEHGGDRLLQKYNKIIEQQTTFAEKVKKTMETAGFSFSQLRKDIEESALAFSDGFLPALARAGTKLDGFIHGHLGDIRTMGVQLGQWLDKIDWKGVENGANSFLGVLKSMLDIISKVPPQVDLAIVGFLGLNKLSGGLLGKGAENIAGGLLGGLGNIGGGLARAALRKIPVVGGAAASLASVHVWVDNFPAGFGAGGGPGPDVPAVLAGAGMAGVATAVAAALAGSLVFWGGIKLITDTLPKTAQNSITPGVNHPVYLGPNRGLGLVQDLGPVPNPGMLDRGGRETGTANYSGNTGQTEYNRQMEAAAQKIRDVKDSSQDAGIALYSAARAADTFAGMTSKLAKSLGMDFHTMISGIEKRSMDKYHWASGHAPASWVMGTFGRQLLRTEEAVLHSHMSARDQLAAVRRLEGLAVAGKDWGVAHRLAREIALLKTKVAAAITTGTATTTAAVKAHQTTITLDPQTVYLTVDGDKLAVALTKRQQWGRAI
jgi:TP901 family phage tail tape measure protein